MLTYIIISLCNELEATCDMSLRRAYMYVFVQSMAMHCWGGGGGGGGGGGKPSVRLHDHLHNQPLQLQRAIIAMVNSPIKEY